MYTNFTSGHRLLMGLPGTRSHTEEMMRGVVTRRPYDNDGQHSPSFEECKLEDSGRIQ